jgi:hypothetical protein
MMPGSLTLEVESQNVHRTYGLEETSGGSGPPQLEHTRSLGTLSFLPESEGLGV